MRGRRTFTSPPPSPTTKHTQTRARTLIRTEDVKKIHCCRRRRHPVGIGVQRRIRHSGRLQRSHSRLKVQTGRSVGILRCTRTLTSDRSATTATQRSVTRRFLISYFDTVDPPKPPIMPTRRHSSRARSTWLFHRFSDSMHRLQRAWARLDGRLHVKNNRVRWRIRKCSSSLLILLL